MRRLALIIAAVALLGATGASAAKPKAHLVVMKGSAHAVGGELRGWFVVANRGTASSPVTTVSVKAAVGESQSEMLGNWVAGRWRIPSLAPTRRRRVVISTRIPYRFAAVQGPIAACLERCRRIGRLTAGNWPPAAQHSAGSGAGSGSGSANLPSTQPLSTIPTEPIPYVAGTPFHHTAGTVEYWAFVPRSYDPSNLTPTRLLIWLHGCDGYSEGDIWVVDPGAEAGVPQDWMTLALSGREAPGNECWIPSVDEAKVMAALADFETHFNVDRQRVILGGYSSGGDLTYRTGFRHSSTFAGLLIENSSPFRDTESTQAESLAAATTKLPIVHLAHEQDTIYPIAGVRHEVEAVKAAGFPIELIERPGDHYDEPGKVVEGHPVPGTDPDLRTILLPYIDAGWLAPSP